MTPEVIHRPDLRGYSAARSGRERLLSPPLRIDW
jgi:hypothetical protein